MIADPICAMIIACFILMSVTPLLIVLIYKNNNYNKNRVQHIHYSKRNLQK